MSDTVAIVSVVVTGVGAPMVAAVTTRWQLRHAVLTEWEREIREILDDAAAKLAQLQRASGHCIALWRRGKTDNDDEVKDQLRSRNEAGEEERITLLGKIGWRVSWQTLSRVSLISCESRTKHWRLIRTPVQRAPRGANKRQQVHPGRPVRGLETPQADDRGAEA